MGLSVRSHASLNACRCCCVCPTDLTVDEELHETGSAFDQPACDQATTSVGLGNLLVDAVAALNLSCFLRQVERVTRGQLHARGEFVAGDSRIELRTSGTIMSIAEILAANPRDVSVAKSWNASLSGGWNAIPAEGHANQLEFRVAAATITLAQWERGHSGRYLPCITGC